MIETYTIISFTQVFRNHEMFQAALGKNDQRSDMVLTTDLLPFAA
jgi:hypothetical protein